MILGIALLAAYGASLLWVGREVSQQRPSETRMMCAVSMMIILALLAGSVLTGGE